MNFASAKQILEPFGIDVDNIKTETTEIQVDSVEEVAMHSAKEACLNSKISIKDHFVGIDKMVNIGAKTSRSIEDIDCVTGEILQKVDNKYLGKVQ